MLLGRHEKGNPQLELGSVPIEAIDINPQSRDDIPAEFIGSKDRIFSLLKEELFRPQDGGQDAGEAKANRHLWAHGA